MYLQLLKKSKHTHTHCSHVIPTLFREALKKYLNKVIMINKRIDLWDGILIGFCIFIS